MVLLVVPSTPYRFRWLNESGACIHLAILLTPRAIKTEDGTKT